MTDLASTLRARLALADPVAVEFRRGDRREGSGFSRERLEYAGLEGDELSALLFMPAGRVPIDGDVFMNKCLDDAQRALSVLVDAEKIDARRVGVAGHSYGGYTALNDRRGCAGVPR